MTIWVNGIILIKNKENWYYWPTRQHKSRNKGWTSADRSTKATLMLTVPRSSKVVYRGFNSANIPCCDSNGAALTVMYYHGPNTGRGGVSLLSSMDSDLEAFSHNPTDGSVAALGIPPTALPTIRTNGSSRTKLDYCRDDQLISRVKLTCLTTV